MKVNVGSHNQTKINAVKNIFGRSEKFSSAEVQGVDVDIEEFGHPKTLESTIEGAIDRAKQAYKDCDLSVGIEGGLGQVPHSKSGYMEVIACAIYDGKTIHLGLGPSFEWPKEVLKLILSGRDGSQAIREAGLTDHPKLGTANGTIDIFTDGKYNRTQTNELAVAMALIHLEHPDHY